MASGDLKLLRVAVRMMLDYLKITDDKEEEFEVGCKCRSVSIAENLKGLVDRILVGFPVRVEVKDELVVVLLPPLKSPSSVEDEPSC